MAVQRSGRRAVSAYSEGGYSSERDLYFDALRAGSRQEALRDRNRAGYAAAGDSPVPFFESEEAAAAFAESGTGRKASFWEALRREAKDDRLGAAMCAFLFVLVLILGGVWGSRLATSLQNRRQIEDYRRRTQEMEEANASLRARLAIVQDGERIRNLAMNEHGMLRPERAPKVEIYVQVPETGARQTAGTAEAPGFEMLDFVLGLLDRLKIGG